MNARRNFCLSLRRIQVLSGFSLEVTFEKSTAGFKNREKLSLVCMALDETKFLITFSASSTNTSDLDFACSLQLNRYDATGSFPLRNCRQVHYLNKAKEPRK